MGSSGQVVGRCSCEKACARRQVRAQPERGSPAPGWVSSRLAGRADEPTLPLPESEPRPSEHDPLRLATDGARQSVRPRSRDRSPRAGRRAGRGCRSRRRRPDRSWEEASWGPSRAAPHISGAARSCDRPSTSLAARPSHGSSSRVAEIPRNSDSAGERREEDTDRASDDRGEHANRCLKALRPRRPKRPHEGRLPNQSSDDVLTASPCAAHAACIGEIIRVAAACCASLRKALLRRRRPATSCSAVRIAADSSHPSARSSARSSSAAASRRTF